MSEQSITFQAPVVFEQSGQIYTNSMSVAICFEKDHAHVMRDIQSLIADSPKDFSRSNFGLAEYQDKQGKPRPLYNLTFDGFILLAMGYTGKKALQMKLAYIAAFNAMKEKLEANNALPESTTLPPSDQNIIQTLVRNIADRYPQAEQKRIYMQVWMRFRNHFRLGSYKDLPPAKMAEAVTYLANFEVREKNAQAALPRAYEPLAEKGAEALANIMDLRRKIVKTSMDIMYIMQHATHHGDVAAIPEEHRQLARELDSSITTFFMCINNNLIGVEHMFKAFCEAEKLIYG